MIESLIFDQESSVAVDDLDSAVQQIADETVLWINLENPTDGELATVRDALGIDASEDRHTAGARPEPSVHLHDEYIHVTSILPPSAENGQDRSSVFASYVGRNWVVTRHESAGEFVDEFRELASGAGQIGGLDAMSFLATLLESIVVGYAEAFEEIEETLEDFDASVLMSNDRDIESRVSQLVEARARVGELRRALAPHRRVFTTLSHTELDAVSTEESAMRFTQLATRVDDVLTSARDAREAVVNSFDMLILRTEHRTNEIVKVLTLASILLLPGALIAAIMGMNVNLTGEEFVTSGLFWGTLAVILLVAAGTLVLARVRRWI